MTTMNFVLQGRDQLSRVLDRAGDSATRLHRRLSAAATNSSTSMNRLARNTTSSMAGLQRDTDAGAKALEALQKSVISLAPAIIPAAAAMAPLVASTTAAGVAVAAYGAALGPQIAAMSEASQAEKAYTDAVEKSGKRSKEAVQAQAEYARTMAKLPPATRTAAASLSVLKDQYKGWSDGLAKDTMGPVVKGMAIFGGLLPKLTPLVKGTSSELDRMMTLLAGGMQSPGFDRLVKQFSEFSTGVLRRANDGIVHLTRSLDTGKVGGGLSEFMAYARAQGPLVGDVLKSIGTALTNLLRAASDVGVGMLQAVNALAKLVAAVPPGVITVLLQLAVALKVAKLAALGMGAARAAVAAFGVQLVAMQTAAAGTPGRLAAVTASIGALSRGAKIALAGTGIGLLVLGLTELATIGKKAPTDMDRMATSMGKFAETGKVSGEAAKVLGSDFKEFDEALRGMARPGTWDQMQQGFTSFFGQDSTPVKRWKGTLDDVDKSLANMVKSGNPQMAAQAFDLLAQRAKSQGMTTAELNKELGDYKSALADQAFAQQLAAQSMGLFGQQALDVQAKLAAQKAGADGLRQSIHALNDAYLMARGGVRGMEAAMDAASAAAKENGKTLDDNTAKGRANNEALDNLASSTMRAAEATYENTGSWSASNKVFDRGRQKLIAVATQMTGNSAAAKRLADQILRAPDKTARLKGNMEDLQAKLNRAKTRLASVPDSRRASVRATIADLEAKIRSARRQLDMLDGKVSTTYVRTYFSSHGQAGSKVPVARRPDLASGGMVGFPSGGPVRGPGTGTSDSILANLSNGEYVVKAKSVAKYGVAFMTALNAGRLSMASALGSGGGSSMGGAGREVGRGLSAGMRASAGGVEASARAMAAAVVTGVRAELQIASPSKKMRALAADTGKGMILGLTGSKAKIASVAKDLVKDIWAAWKGTRSTKDSRLVVMVNRDTKKLQSLASKRDALASRIAEAKKFAGELTASARQGAELGSLGLQPEDVSAGSIKGGLSAKLQQIRTFTTYISQLAKKGLHKGLLRQILNMGPDQGYAYASALLGADKATFAQVNSLQSQIDKSATTLGRTGADAMYDSGKNAGRGFLRGLIDQQKAIEQQMLKIAKGMQKAIKKALGIRSPSQVMAQLGRHSTEGLAVGLTQRMPFLDKALGAVAGRVAATRPVMGRPALAGGGSGSAASQSAPVTITINGAMDPVAVGREVRRVLLELKRTYGLNVNLGVG